MPNKIYVYSQVSQIPSHFTCSLKPKTPLSRCWFSSLKSACTFCGDSCCLGGLELTLVPVAEFSLEGISKRTHQNEMCPLTRHYLPVRVRVRPAASASLYCSKTDTVCHEREQQECSAYSAVCQIKCGIWCKNTTHKWSRKGNVKHTMDTLC
jgi:hypothetical protein